MTFKLDIGTKQGKTYHYEISDENVKARLIGKKIGDVIKGDEISNEFLGYEFKITGLSDIRGFPGIKGIKGRGVKKVILSYGVGMRQRRPKGYRRKKSVHGDEIGEDIVQINMKVVKEGNKNLSEIFGKNEEKDESVENKEEKNK